MMNYIRTSLIRFGRGSRLCSTTTTFTIPTKSSSSPLIEKFRSSWPDPVHNAPSVDILDAIPERTVPDSALKFRMTARLESGTSIFYPHLDIHPGDMKVKLEVFIQNIKLKKLEKRIFIQMLGKRYSPGNGKVTLISRRFPNRIENKKWLIYTLELLLSKAKSLAMVEGKYADGKPDNDKEERKDYDSTVIDGEGAEISDDVQTHTP